MFKVDIVTCYGDESMKQYRFVVDFDCNFTEMIGAIRHLPEYNSGKLGLLQMFEPHCDTDRIQKDLDFLASALPLKVSSARPMPMIAVSLFMSVCFIQAGVRSGRGPRSGRICPCHCFPITPYFI